MRIYFNELIKAVCKKSTLCIFAVLLILNGVLIYQNEKSSDTLYTASEYKTLYEDLENKTLVQANKELETQYNKISAFIMLTYGDNIDEIIALYPDLNAQELLKEYDNKNYLKYCNDIFAEQELFQCCLEEIDSAVNYDDYLKGIDENAKRMTMVSLFSKPGTFSYRNIAKTPEDFAHLKDSELEIGPSKGISMATGFLATDLIGLLMIMTIVVTIVTREKELNQIVLSRTTFKGRAALGTAKLCICFSVSFIIEILLYSVNFWISYYTYGFGDLSRQIQSVYGFIGSNLQISVFEYFLLFLVAKLVVYCIFASLIYLIAVISNTSVKVYGILVITLASEAVLYYTIPSESYLCLLKYVNIIAYANTKDMFASYLNLNLFGQPVNYFIVFILSTAVLLFAFSIISVVAFSKQRVLKSRTNRFSHVRINLFKGKTTSLFLQESYKIFIGGKALFVLILFALFVMVTYEPVNVSFASSDEIYYKQYMLKFEGEYNHEKQVMIDKEEQRISEAKTKMNEEMENNDGNNILIIMKYQDILAPQYAFDKVKAHAKYLKSTPNGEFVYDSGYKLLTGDETAGNKDLTLGLTAMAMVICCLVYVFSIEYQTGANVLLKTSAKGRKGTFIRKIIIGLIIVTIIYIITYAPYFYNVLNAYGIRKIDAPICSLEGFSNWDMSIKGYLIFISIIRYIALICAMLIIYFLSCRLKSIIATILTSTAILLLPILLSLLGLKFFDYVLLNPIIIGNL